MLKKLSIVDKLFALLRILVFLGGSLWVWLSAPLLSHQISIIYDFIFFGIYSILLYYFIFKFPGRIRQIYQITLYLDLIFIFWLVRFTGSFNSEFFLAFLLLIALHSFYFGLTTGIWVIFLSVFVYLFAGNFNLSSENYLQIGLRVAFFFLVGISMGLLSRKELLDRRKIENLNKELKIRQDELEQEKNKLASILMGIDAGLILINTNREILWMNKVSERWFGPSEYYVGKDCKSLFNTNSPCKKCPTEQTLKNGTIENTEIEYPQENAGTRYYRITSAPLFNENKQIDRVLELVQDISEEKELQLHLIQTSKLAAMGELASGVAHEINNPLSSIAVCVQELTDFIVEDLEAEKTEIAAIQSLECIKSEIQRCKRITTGLLNIAPRAEPRRVPVNVNELLRNVRLLVTYKADKEHKDLKLNLCQNLDLIMGESDTLSQVFLNLMLNAIEFTPAGKSVEIQTSDRNDSFVQVKIIDQGCGISSQNLDKIFKPFFTTKPTGMGTGLGLSISYRIVKNLGGDIKVESTPLKGSIFTILLPKYKEPSLA